MAATFGHLEALEEIAGDNGGHRERGSTGYQAAADYVTETLEAAGYDVGQLTQDAEVVVESGSTFTVGVDHYTTIPMSGTPSTDGAIEAPLSVPADPVGCAAADYGSAADTVIVVERGDCTFGQKSALAAEAGALGLIVYSADGATFFAGDLGSGTEAVPSVTVASDTSTLLGQAEAGERATFSVNVVTESVSTVNVIADWPGEPDRVVILGAHLDSVTAGPGINDNASGVALTLALAERWAADGMAEGIRLAFWDAEEIGLLGSRAYVDALTDAEVGGIAAYVNLDMVASPNGVVGVYGDDPARGVVERSFGDDPFVDVDLAGFSDHAVFQGRGVPVAGVHTGAGEEQSAADVEVFGGVEGQPRDECYHQECDDLETVDTPAVRERLDSIAQALLSAVPELAG